MTQPDFARIDRVLAECDAKNLPPLDLTAVQGSHSGPESPESDLRATCQALHQSVDAMASQAIAHDEARRRAAEILGLDQAKAPARRRIRWPWRRTR